MLIFEKFKLYNYEWKSINKFRYIILIGSTEDGTVWITIVYTCVFKNAHEFRSTRAVAVLFEAHRTWIFTQKMRYICGNTKWTQLFNWRTTLINTGLLTCVNSHEILLRNQKLGRNRLTKWQNWEVQAESERHWRAIRAENCANAMP